MITINNDNASAGKNAAGSAGEATADIDLNAAADVKASAAADTAQTENQEATAAQAAAAQEDTTVDQDLAEQEARKKKRKSNIKLWSCVILILIITPLIDYYCIHNGGKVDVNDASGFLEAATKASLPITGFFTDEEYAYLQNYIIDLMENPLTGDYPHIALSDDKKSISSDMTLVETASEEQTVAMMEDMITMLAGYFPDKESIVLYGKYGSYTRAGQVEAHNGVVGEVVLEAQGS